MPVVQQPASFIAQPNPGNAANAQEEAEKRKNEALERAKKEKEKAEGLAKGAEVKAWDAVEGGGEGGEGSCAEGEVWVEDEL